MDLSKLDSTDRMAAIAALIVVVLGVVSIINDWGTLMIVPILAGLAVLAVVLMPQLSPQTTIPAPKPMVLLAAGAVAALAWLLVAIDWLTWIVDHLGAVDTLQFLVGLVASFVLAWAGWQAFQASRGSTSTPTPSG
jgi:hypothetical protein